jgi:hypothetical protein
VSVAAAERWLERAWLLLVASSALYFLGDNEADNDLWVHLFSGRVIVAAGPPHVDGFSYTAAGAPWIDHEWLTQAGFALVHAGAGSTGLWLLKLAIALLTAWLVWLPLARRTESPWVRGGVMVLTLAVLARGYAVRPQIVSYLGVAALLAWLDREPRVSWKTLLAIALAFVAWANAHGAVIVGIGILTLAAVLRTIPSPLAGEACPEHRRRGQDGGATRNLHLMLPIVAAIAACLTPYGPRLFLYVLDELRAPHPLTEWQPIDLGDAAHLPFLVMLTVLVITLPFARTLRRRPWWAVLVAGIAVMALRQQRHTPLFALCAAVPLAEQCDAALTWLAARTRFRLSPPATTLAAAALIALASFQFVSVAERLWRDGGRIVFDAREYPVGSLQFLQANQFTGNLAVPLDWGGYALWHGAPAIKVSLDGRFATVYPPAVVEDGFAFFRSDGDPRAARLLDAYDTTLVLAPRGVTTPIDGRSDWRLLYSDSVAALYGISGVRASAESQARQGWLPFP